MEVASFLSLIFSNESSIMVTFCNILNSHRVFCHLCSNSQIFSTRTIFHPCSPEFPRCFWHCWSFHLSWKSRKKHTCHFVPLIFLFLLSLSLSSFPELCPWPFVPLFLLSQIQIFQICFSISGLSLAWQNLQDVFLWPKRSWNVTISTPLSFWCFSFSSTSIFKGVLSSLNSRTACPYSTLFYYQKKKKCNFKSSL